MCRWTGCIDLNLESATAQASELDLKCESYEDGVDWAEAKGERSQLDPGY